MRKLVELSGVVGLFAAGAVLAQGDKTPSIKDIMGKLGKGTTSLCPTLAKELERGTRLPPLDDDRPRRAGLGPRRVDVDREARPLAPVEGPDEGPRGTIPLDAAPDVDVTQLDAASHAADPARPT